MKYALYLDETRRVQYVTTEEYSVEGMPLVDTFPEGDLLDYQYINNEFVYNPIIVEKLEEKPSQFDILEAKLIYIAMMTDTLDGLEEMI